MTDLTASAIADIIKATLRSELDRRVEELAADLSAIGEDRFFAITRVLQLWGIQKALWLRWEKDGKVPPRRVLPSGRTGYFASDLRKIRESLPTVLDAGTPYERLRGSVQRARRVNGNFAASSATP